jgi:hypothetical protein
MGPQKENPNTPIKCPSNWNGTTTPAKPTSVDCFRWAINCLGREKDGPEEDKVVLNAYRVGICHKNHANMRIFSDPQMCIFSAWVFVAYTLNPKTFHYWDSQVSSFSCEGMY